MTITLKYPEGEFTQAELAAFNGMEKAAVYIPLKEAHEDGILEKTGTRPTGKRPSNLYRVVSGNASVPMPVVAQPIAVVVDEAPSAPVVLPVVNIAPVAEVVPVINLVPDSAYPCPLCKGPMVVIPDATGVTVKCFNPLPCVQGCNENPYGHGKNAKEAWEIAGEKFHI